MNDQTRTDKGRLWALGTLVLVVIGIVGVAFRGSWGAFRDAALACHLDRTSANTYGLAVDGLMVVAIVSAVLLRHNLKARRYCLRIIAGYTVASLLINYLHGLGMFGVDLATGKRPVPPWPVVFVIALLLVGSIFLGSHLLVYVWRHMFPEAPAAEPVAETYQAGTEADDDGTAVPTLPPPAYDNAKDAYRASLAPQLKTLTVNDLVSRYGVTVRQVRRIRSEVKDELAAATAEATAEEPADEPEPHTMNGRVRAGVTGDLS